jgi:hypothetical protein
LRLELSTGWRIEGSSQAPPAALAETELDEALVRIVGARPSGDHPVVLALSHGEGDGEGFRWEVGDGRIELHGDQSRALLYAVYSFLEALGCRWPWLGRELLPDPSSLALPAGTVKEEPALPGRCLVLGERAMVERAEEWIEWAARNRLNTVFAHVGFGDNPYGAAPEAIWLNRREGAVAAARQRAMTIEHGGHLLEQIDDLEDHFRSHREADVFHLWGGDVPRGGEGGDEDGPTPSDRALAAANDAAGMLERTGLASQVSFLAYHDTEGLPERERPRHNVCLLWAPRERCYEHPARDGDCPENARYAETFRAQVELFRSAGAAPPRVFEYYLDRILFSGGLPTLGPIIAGDLAFYRDAGAHTVQALATGPRAGSDPHPNAWLFARLAWDAGQDPEALLAQFQEADSRSGG